MVRDFEVRSEVFRRVVRRESRGLESAGSAAEVEESRMTGVGIESRSVINLRTE